MAVVRAAIVESGVVVNVVMATEAEVNNLGWIQSDSVGVGDLWDGNSFSRPAPPVQTVPDQVSRRQFMQQLIYEGLDDEAEALIDAITDPIERKLMRSWYRDSQVFERDRPELIQMADSMGKTQTDLDEFFKEAVTR